MCRHVHVPQDVRGARPLSGVPRQAAVQGHATELTTELVFIEERVQ